MRNRLISSHFKHTKFIKVLNKEYLIMIFFCRSSIALINFTHTFNSFLHIIHYHFLGKKKTKKKHVCALLQLFLWINSACGTEVIEQFMRWPSIKIIVWKRGRKKETKLQKRMTTKFNRISRQVNASTIVGCEWWLSCQKEFISKNLEYINYFT